MGVHRCAYFCGVVRVWYICVCPGGRTDVGYAVFGCRGGGVSIMGVSVCVYV